MEQLKAVRGQLRRQFTIIWDNFNKVFKDNEEINIKIKFAQLEEKYSRLEEVDKKLETYFLSSDLNENEMEEEFNKTEKYQNNMIEARVLFDEYMKHTGDRAHGVVKTYDIPKLAIKQYELSYRTFIAWFAQMSRVHDDTQLDPEAKFQYLIQSLLPETKAWDIVTSYPPSGENYEKVMKQLTSRFGRKETLIEVYIRDLLSLVISQLQNSNLNVSELYDKLLSYLNNLEALNVTKAEYAAMLFPLVESCLPADLLKLWERTRYKSHTDADSVGSKVSLDEDVEGEMDDLQKLMKFLELEVQSEERVLLAQNSLLPCKQPYTGQALVSEQSQVSCCFCNKAHNSQDCITAQSWTIEKRKELIIRNRRCFICLKSNHSSKQCRAAVKCIICRGRHFPILCFSANTKQSESDNLEKKESVHASQTMSTCTYLKTLTVKIQTKNKTKIVRVLIDDGSHGSYIAKDLVDELRLQRAGTANLSHGLFGGVTTPAVEHNIYNITLQNIDESFCFNLQVLDSKGICGELPRVTDKRLLEELRAKNIRLTDLPSKNEKNPPPIMILLGAGEIGEIMTGKIERLKGGLTAIETKLGWSVLGKSTNKKKSLDSFNLLNAEVPSLWKLDLLGIQDDITLKSQKCLEEELYCDFKTNLLVNKEGRYEMPLTWIDGHPILDSNVDIAIYRLEKVAEKLIKSNLLFSYDQVFQEWLTAGIIEIVKVNDETVPCHYLPHRPVVKESSVSTKIRPVFDASAHKNNQVSLNDCLHKGPNLLQHMFPLLMGFRLGKIGITSDVKQAFLQLSISECDRDYLRFLWYKDVEELNNTGYSQFIIFRHCRAVFGVSCSPYLLNATLQHHLSENRWGPLYDETLQLMKESFYVDDCTTSVRDELHLKLFMEQASEIMKDGNFDLTKWAYTGQCDEERSVLGIKWSLKEDVLHLVKPDIQNILHKPFTKRILLSVVSRVFDILGIACAALLKPKLLLQEAWKLKLGWDEPLPEKLHKQFEKWLQSFSLMENLTVPRWFLQEGIMLQDCTLHVFCDASSSAFATVLFLRHQNKEVKVEFVAAKSRLAPMEPASICRLELMAAVIGVRLWESVVKVLPKVSTHFWVDSMVVLNWLHNTQDAWATFVSNRVNEIKSKTDLEQWHYVPGELNAADLPSRGCTFLKLLQSRWLEGPAWLKLDSKDWPKHVYEECEEALSEKRKTVQEPKVEISMTTLDIDKEVKEDLSVRFSQFGKYWKNVRVCAWIKRFYINMRRPSDKKIGPLSDEEIQAAEMCLFKLVQDCWNEKDKQKFFATCDNRQVFEDEHNLLRLKTKLILGQDDEFFQAPIVLPDHRLTRQLILDTHILWHHCGVQTTWSDLRNKFWISRKLISSVLKTCVVCKRFQGKSIQTDSAPLPVQRTERVSAFEVCGVDLAGPLFLRDGSKTWIVLYTCAVYRAVHLEMVTSLSADCFMQSLRRFIARRGRCSTLISDRGSNFVKTDNLMTNLNWEEITKSTSVLRIKWKFNCAAAPWWGGFWERLVGVMKDLLRKGLGRASLNYEELSTMLCDIESVINNRPLTYVSGSPSELIAITPTMFIQDLRTNETVDLDTIDSINLIKRFQYLQGIRTGLRNRFRNEYLGQLVHNRIAKNKIELKPGEVVLVSSENMKRIDWPLAVVLELFQGKDGVTRAAKVRLSHNRMELTRPVQKLYPLEITVAEVKEFKGKLKDHKTLVEPVEDKVSKVPEFTSRLGRRVKAPTKLDL